MDTKTIKKLNKINENFYKTTASDFDSSRQYFWQGWSNLTKYLSNLDQIKMLDLGCGNSRFYQFIKENFPNKKINYLGIDSNQKLLEFAQNKFGDNDNFNLQKTDIISSLIENNDFIKQNGFDVVVSFGVFHHIPSFDLRLRLLNYLKSKITKNGLIIISLWQFMDYERFRKKTASNSQLAELNLKNLEKNDYILDWKRGEEALRYCHFIDGDEQDKLIEKSGLKLVESFKADGKEKNVNTYLVLMV